MAVTNSKWFGLASRSRCWKNHARTACQLCVQGSSPQGILQHPASPPGCNCCLFPSPPFMPFRVKAILITSSFLKRWEGVTKGVLVPSPFLDSQMGVKKSFHLTLGPWPQERQLGKQCWTWSWWFRLQAPQFAVLVRKIIEVSLATFECLWMDECVCVWMHL